MTYTREQAIDKCRSYSNKVADSRWVEEIFDDHEAEVAKLKEEVDALKEQVGKLEEYKFMYEGLQ